jgi:hypothetical protein
MHGSACNETPWRCPRTLISWSPRGCPDPGRLDANELKSLWLRPNMLDRLVLDRIIPGPMILLREESD